MAGLYLHIPFCKQACTYCNFHFSTQQQHLPAMVAAMQEELKLRHRHLSSTTISSIYFGGGTPSLLSINQLASLWDTINHYYQIDDRPEVTLEANPDDLHPGYLKSLRHSPVNRLSIGVQSFHNADLLLMHRTHTAEEAINAIQKAQESGFTNINMDLIYGIPGASQQAWEENVQQFLKLNLPHLSSYCLTVEPHTVLHHQVKKGQVQLPDDETIETQYLYLHQVMTSAGYRHYEISNFAMPGHEAIHNSSYWQGAPYLGIGPGAHSFIHGQRSWNVAHNHQYLKAIGAGQLPSATEGLSLDTQFNEYLLTRLRTDQGIDLLEVAESFGENYAIHLHKETAPFLAKGQLYQEGDRIGCKPSAWLLSDHIISSLFVDTP